MVHKRNSEELGRLVVSFFFLVAAGALFFAGISRIPPAKQNKNTEVLGETSTQDTQFARDISAILEDLGTYSDAVYTQTVDSEQLKLTGEYMVDVDDQVAYADKTLTNPATGEVQHQEESIHNGSVNIRTDQGESKFGIEFANPLLKTKEAFLDYLNRQIISETRTELEDGTVRYTFRTEDSAGFYDLEAIVTSDGDVRSLTFPYSDGGSNTIIIRSHDTGIEVPSFEVTRATPS
ncbi:MAG: hypothetical protein TR69_WS6001001495 [candidate division WS6 bacterium OLB20]|uniref:Uncharacterized protein n=1 Tax=candidate division WS6 bacterium OLB20 TaxID=1617426 RepID=A0A136LW76_9BACT|nr:MAG: hypothetical protein TR69_WS6001001495 [candidate division WS6 bacterium OLB20]